MNNRSKTTSEQFISLLQTHKGIIYKVANSYCKREEDCKDLIQEITLQLWRSFGSYDDRYKISTWMYRIALNVSISFYAKEKRREKLSQALPQDIIFMHENEEVRSNLDENLDQLKRFIKDLKELDRALILLYLEGNDQKEMAEILGLTVSNVSTRVGRIKKKLRKNFSNIKN